MSTLAIILAVTLYLVIGFVVFLITTFGSSRDDANFIQQFFMLPYTTIVVVMKRLSA
jgi:cation transporter-like permease